MDEGSTVTLDGSESTGTAETVYSWAQLSGPPLTWQTTSDNRIQFTAPEVSQDTELVFTLTLTTGSASVSDAVMVLVRDTSPAVQPYVVSIAISADQAVVDASVPVSYSATIVEGQTQSGDVFSWLYGDGSTEEGPELSRSHSFSKPGVYLVSVCVAATTGGVLQTACSEKTTTIVRFPPPKLNVVRALDGASAMITMSCESQPAQDFQIRYTLDGSVPTKASALYSGTISLRKSAQLTARVFAASTDADSRIASDAVTTSVVVTPPTSSTPGNTPVEPGRLVITPSDVIACSGNQGGPFGPADKAQATYTLTNPGGSAIEWSASANVAWLTLSSTSGFLDPGGFIPAQLSVSVDQVEAGKLAAGSHTGTVTLTNVTNGFGNDTRMAYVTVDAVATTVATPTISPNGGSHTDSVSVALACSTAGATIRYTTTGSDPTGSSTIYTGPVTLTSSARVKAKAFKSGCTDSALASASFTVTPSPVTVATPTISPNGGSHTDSVSVALACSTAGATIRYTTTGSDPTASSTIYTGPVTLTSSATVKAKAFKSGCTDSALASASFTVTPSPVTVATPTISPNGGSHTDSVSVALACSTAGATIRYTTTGSDPTASSTIYTGPVTLTSSATVKAKGFKSGCTDSALASASFTVTPSPVTVATPTISPNGGSHTDSVSVALACSTAGATIRYTTTGSDPTASST
ncbi:MAG: chitobiase/beta-hexosaminidase C-terminal domain-containing protein, partial [Phycisphaerae bacterium]|nr:chitobiase/beta-hexosaminidase C-terminal domain-containing protein [Phycisphaerae bacterium]